MLAGIGTGRVFWNPGEIAVLAVVADVGRFGNYTSSWRYRRRSFDVNFRRGVSAADMRSKSGFAWAGIYCAHPSRCGAQQALDEEWPSSRLECPRLQLARGRAAERKRDAQFFDGARRLFQLRSANAAGC